jgi:hypothetical protein
MSFPEVLEIPEQILTAEERGRARSRSAPVDWVRIDWFICGPLPGPWVSKAARLGAPCPQLLLAIWELAGLERNRNPGRVDLVLSGKVCVRYGVSRHMRSRGLRLLESAGLVFVRRCRGCCPRVTILPYTGDGQNG